MIVVDTSAIIEVLLRTPEAHLVATHLNAGGASLHAPHLIDLETLQVLRRYEAQGQLDNQRSHAALLDFSSFPIRRHAHNLLMPRVWELRHNFTAYDAAYVALAEALGAKLLTRDKRLATGAAQYVNVVLVQPFIN